MYRLIRVFALVSASIVCVMLSQAVAAGQPTRGSGECIALGLKPIPAKLTLFLEGDSAVHIPTLKVTWSAKPLPKRCGVRTVVSVRARVRFPKVGHTLELPEQGRPWQVFWLGRTHVDDAEQILSGPAVTFDLGCVERPRAWLRYEVESRSGRTLAQLVRPVPISSEICQR